MPYSVYQHWDPLRVCVVGQSYPPEFYHWIKVPHVRNLFEKIAQETEEDFQNIIQTLHKFGVETLRPNFSDFDSTVKIIPSPPMTPRDTMVMIGEKFYYPKFNWKHFYSDIKDSTWAWYETPEEFLSRAKPWQIKEVCEVHHLEKYINGESYDPRYNKIIQKIKDNKNQCLTAPTDIVNGAMVSRIGVDLFFATNRYDQDRDQLLDTVRHEFPDNRNHIVNTGGHGDGTYCPVCPGLIISLRDVPTYAKTFPGWEVVYLPEQSWRMVQPFLDLKTKNQGRWWIPGFEYDQDVIDVVENWLDHWVGYVEETVFDVNMLIIDPKNVMVFNENEQVFQALDRYGITPHIVPFRHRYFWDGGIHCVTLDLDRAGNQQDFFPDQKKHAMTD